MTIQSFREPWQAIEMERAGIGKVWRIIDAEHDHGVLSWEHEDGTYTCHRDEQTIEERVVSCVNAMEGLVPSELKPLIEAVESPVWVNDPIGWAHQAKAALARLRGMG